MKARIQQSLKISLPASDQKNRKLTVQMDESGLSGGRSRESLRSEFSLRRTVHFAGRCTLLSTTTMSFLDPSKIMSLRERISQYLIQNSLMHLATKIKEREMMAATMTIMV